MTNISTAECVVMSSEIVRDIRELADLVSPGVCNWSDMGVTAVFRDQSVLCINTNGHMLAFRGGPPSIMMDFTSSDVKGVNGCVSPGSTYSASARRLIRAGSPETESPGSPGSPLGIAEMAKSPACAWVGLSRESDWASDRCVAAKVGRFMLDILGQEIGVKERSRAVEVEILARGGMRGPFGLVGFPDGSLLRMAGTVLEVHDNPGLRVLVAMKVASL